MELSGTEMGRMPNMGGSEPAPTRHEKLVDYLLVLLTGTISVILIIIWIFVHGTGDNSLSSYLSEIIPHLVTISLVSFVTSIFLKRIIDYKNEREISKIASAVQEKLTPHLDKIALLETRYEGINQVLPHLMVNELVPLIFNSKHSVRILNVWIPSLEDLSPAIHGCASRDVKVQLLIANPASQTPHMRQNAFSLDSSERREIQVNNQLRQNLNDSENIKRTLPSEKKSNFQLRCYHDIFPPFSIYQIDSKIFIGLFWLTDRAVDRTQFVIDPDSLLGRRVMDQFSRLWDQSAPDIENWRNDITKPPRR